MNKRPFGVEIECGGDMYPEQVEELLYDNGLKDWADEGVDYDGSGCEIRSPKLIGRAGLNSLEKVMTLLNDNGFYTDIEHDGMHVHHDVSDLELEDLHRITYSWYNNQEHIHGLVDEYRINNRWCPPVTLSDIQTIEREIKARDEGNLEEMKSYYNYNTDRIAYEKYRNLSLNAKEYTETIEIRLHEGTLEFERARAWILFGQAFISNIAKRKRHLPPYGNIAELFKAIKPYKAARDYYAPVVSPRYQTQLA